MAQFPGSVIDRQVTCPRAGCERNSRASFRMEHRPKVHAGAQARSASLVTYPRDRLQMGARGRYFRGSQYQNQAADEVKVLRALLPAGLPGTSQLSLQTVRSHLPSGVAPGETALTLVPAFVQSPSCIYAAPIFRSTQREADKSVDVSAKINTQMTL